jgi:hypothetical protein
MPRGVNFYDEATFQGRIWTPKGAFWGSKIEALYSLSDLVEGATPDGGGFNIVSGNVSQLTDRSGRGRHLVTNGVDPLPTYQLNSIGIHPGASFGGTSVLATSAFSLAIPFGFVVLFKTSATALDLFSVMLNDPANSNQIGFYPRHNSFGDRPIIYAGVEMPMTPSAALSTSTTYIASGLFNGASSSGAINGAAWQTGNTGAATMTGGFMINVNATNVHFIGYVTDLVWISNATRNALRYLEGWMAWHSGVQSILDSSHPYRYRPPLVGV